MSGALSAVVVAALVVAGSPPAGAGETPGTPAGPAGNLPVNPGLPSVPALSPPPLPGLPPVGKPPAPQPPAPQPPAAPGGPLPRPGGRAAAPPPAAGPGAAAPAAAAPAAPPPAATLTPDSGAAIIAEDPGADVYPQPPVDPATTPQSRLVARLDEVQHRVQYLQNVLIRTRADLAAAQEQVGPVPLLVALFTDGAAPGASPAQGSFDTPQGRVLALSAAMASGKAELARRQTEAYTLQQQVNSSVQQAMALTAAAPAATADYGGGKLRQPVPGAVTSGFGNRIDPYYHVWQLHAGIDLGAPAGTDIVAAAAGRVTRAGWSGGYGNYTCIDHAQVDGQRLSTCYGHQQRILVSPGQQVSAGQVIGQVGSTGASTGPHLHFEVRLGGRPVDPMPWL